MDEAEETGANIRSSGALGPIESDHARHRRDHRRRNFRSHRAGCGHYAGPAIVVSFVLSGIRLRIRGPLLRRIRLADSHRRLGIYLRLRDAGRDLRLDYRLGSDSGIRLRRRDGGLGMERLRRSALLQDFGIRISARAGSRTPGTRVGSSTIAAGQILGSHRAGAATARASIRRALPHAIGVFNLVALLRHLPWSPRFSSWASRSPRISTTRDRDREGRRLCLVFIGLGAHYVIQHAALVAANWHPFLPRQYR